MARDAPLGRKTKKCGVLVWQCEEEGYDLEDAINILGYDPTTDAKLLIFEGNTDENTIENLAVTLAANQDIGMCYVETLCDIMHVGDLNDNAEATKVFAKWDKLIAQPFSHRCGFVLLHHLRKRDNVQDESDAIMGSTNLAARVDGVMFMKKIDGKRQFWTEVRKGEDIERCYLEYDETTRTNRLGSTVQEEKKADVDATEQRITTDMLNYYALNPGAKFETECRIAVEGNNNLKRKIQKKLLATGQIIRSGKGNKTSPFVFHVAEIPIEQPKEHHAISTIN